MAEEAWFIDREGFVANGGAKDHGKIGNFGFEVKTDLVDQLGVDMGGAIKVGKKCVEACDLLAGVFAF